MNVMKRNELEARNEVKWETYTKKIQIEARVMGDLAMNHIIPVATHYQSQLAKNVQNMVNIFGDVEGKQLSERNIRLYARLLNAQTSSRRVLKNLSMHVNKPTK